MLKIDTRVSLCQNYLIVDVTHERLQLKVSAQPMAMLLFVAISDDCMLLIFILVHTVTKELRVGGGCVFTFCKCHPILFLYSSFQESSLHLTSCL